MVALIYTAKGADAALARAKSFANPNSAVPVSDMLVADVMVKNGKRAEAAAYLEKVLSSNPSSNLALKLASVYETDADLKRPIALLERWTKRPQGRCGFASAARAILWSHPQLPGGAHVLRAARGGAAKRCHRVEQSCLALRPHQRS
jgi:hypothetical protein